MVTCSYENFLSLSLSLYICSHFSVPVSWEETLWQYLHSQEIALDVFFFLSTAKFKVGSRQLFHSHLSLLKNKL